MEWLASASGSWLDRTTPLKDQVKVTALLLLSIALAASIYSPGLSGSFLFDDVVTLSTLQKTQGVTDSKSALEFIFGSSAGALGRPVSMLSFLIDDQYWNGDPASYKYTNLMIHLLCGVLIAGFFLVLLKPLKVSSNVKLYLPVILAAIWLVHPFNVSTTLYIVQRMTQLMSLFAILTLISFLYGRQILATHKLKGYLLMSGGMAVFGLLSIFSKESAVSIIFYILVIEFTLYRNTASDKHYKYWLTAFIYLPILILAIFFISRWDSFLATYQLREFTLGERLLTECRIIFKYLFHVLLPTSIGTGVIHDDIIISKGLLSPVSTLFSLVGILALITGSIKYAKKVPHLSFGILWFLSGHLLESTFIPLELYFEHRNYLPMLGPLYSLFYYVFQFVADKNTAAAMRFPYVVAGLFILISCLFTHQSTGIWGHSFNMLKIWALEHPNSPRAQRLYGQGLANAGYPNEAIQHLSVVYNKLDYDFSMPLAVSYIACKHNLPNPYSLQDMLAFAQKARFSSSLVHNMKNLVTYSLQKGDCQPFSIDEISEILKTTTSAVNLYPAAKADMFILLSHIYVSKGQLSPSLEALDNAFEANKDPVILIRKAELLYSAGLFTDALNFLSDAEKLVQRGGKNKYRYSNQAVIDAFRKKIDISMKNENKAG